MFSEHFAEAKRAGLGITLHIAEVLVLPSSFFFP